MIISGGLGAAEPARRHTSSRADAVMIARGSLGSPSISRSSPAADTCRRPALRSPPSSSGCSTAASSHWGPERAARNLRKFYPWYLERLGISGRDADSFQRTESVEEVRLMLARALEMPAPDAFSDREYAPL